MPRNQASPCISGGQDQGSLPSSRAPVTLRVTAGPSEAMKDWQSGEGPRGVTSRVSAARLMPGWGHGRSSWHAPCVVRGHFASRTFSIQIMACSHCISSNRQRRSGWLAFGALVGALAVACASGELPARTSADPANPSAPEGAPAPAESTALPASSAPSSPHVHGHEGHSMTSPAGSSSSPTPAHNHAGH